MPLHPKLSSFWCNLLHTTHIEQDLDEEARSYIEMLTDEKVKAGVAPEEAQRAAFIEFGGVDQVKEQVRDVQVGVFLETLWQDLRYAARSLAESPGFTAVALLSLALGIGLNTAIFSMINAVLLRPLPYKDPERLVRLDQISVPSVAGSGVAPASCLDWKEQNRVFKSMAIYERLFDSFTMATESETTQIRGQRVSASFFPLLGVPPALGRTFLDEEDKPGANVAVLSHGLWQRHFDSDPNVVGRDITLNQESYRVIGVMPEGFRYFAEYGFDAGYQASLWSVDLWLPYPFETNAPTNRWFFTLSVIARLMPKVTLEQARLEMDLIAQRLKREYPEAYKEMGGVWLGPLHEAVLGQTRSSLRLAWGAVGLVLLIACANVANLLLARAGVRKREITIRSAMGASRRRLVRQLLTESFLLALLGGAGGLILAVTSTNLLNNILPTSVARFDETSLDFRVLIFALLATLVTGVLFGLVPALDGSKVQISSMLAEGGRAAMRGRTGMRLQRILVALQVGLSLVLLTGAGLMVNSFWRLHQIHLGFNPGNLLVLRCVRLMVPPLVTELGLKESGGTKARHVVLNPDAMRFPELVVERLQALPGVESATGAYAFPMVRTVDNVFKIEGRPEPSPQEAERMDAQEFPVSSGYFRTLGIRLSRGRDFNDRDTQNAPRVVIINQAMERGFWPEEANALGNRITWGDPKQTAEIVGVVEDVRSWPQQPSVPQIYIPLSQSWLPSHPYPGSYLFRWRYITFALRTYSDPATLATAARSAVEEVDKSQPVEWIRKMDNVVSGRFEPWRATMLLFGLFAGLAMLLSAIGIYGVISYAVTERTHEIGVRIALGARPDDVLRMVMKGGFLLTLIGIVLGSIAAYWLTQLISSHLFEVKPTDPLTFACVAIVLMGVAMVACYLPARRAARQDPMVALRCD